MQKAVPETSLSLARPLAVLAVGFALWAVSPPVGAEELPRAAAELRARQAVELQELAAWCQQQGLTPQARKTRDLLGRRHPYKLYLPVLPETVGRPPLPADASPELREWADRLARLRHDHANALYELARRAIRARQASLAFDLALAAIHANPDHETVRRLMGYQEFRGRWHTAYEVRKLRAGQVWHEEFGWLPKSHVRRYEEGQRYTGRRWVSAAEDARRHENIRYGWDVETEHFVIRTNHSLRAGVALGVKLERLLRIWRQLFIRYYASEADVRALFDGRVRSRRPTIPQFHVVLFRDRHEYNTSLRAAMRNIATPNIAMSIGAYVEHARRAYFFVGKECDDRTMYHEATHQLFHQSRPVAPHVGRQCNFWIVEGVALYMESLRREGDFWVLGGFQDPRIYAARYRLLQDRFYVPLEEFVGYGMERIQTDERIATLYSQAAGLTHFLVHYDDGRYRDALVAYLSAVYSGRDSPRTLSELTGTTYPELDRQYRQFMQQSLVVAPAAAS